LYKIAKKNKKIFLLKLIVIRVLIIIFKFIINIKVIRTNNNFFKHCDGDIPYQSIEILHNKPTSILKTEDSYSNPFRKKKVTFNSKQNEVRTYELSNKEKFDKIKVYNQIKRKNSYLINI